MTCHGRHVLDYFHLSFKETFQFGSSDKVNLSFKVHACKPRIKLLIESYQIANGIVFIFRDITMLNRLTVKQETKFQSL